MVVTNFGDICWELSQILLADSNLFRIAMRFNILSILKKMVHSEA